MNISINRKRVMVLVSGGVGVIAAGLLLLLIFAWQASAHLPGFQELRRSHHPSDLALLSRSGSLLQTVRVDPKRRALAWQSWQNFPAVLVPLVIQAEDQRFWTHAGVDLLAMGRALKIALLQQGQQGASTISMQLAAMLYHRQNRRHAPSRLHTIWWKLVQIAGAMRLERSWSKPEILEAYLNLAPFRSEQSGIEAATQALFGKRTSDLNAAESAIIVALLRSPNSPSAKVRSRACALLLAQKSAPQLADVCATIPALPLRQLQAPQAAPLPIFHFARLIARHAGANLFERTEAFRTTLDSELQRRAVQALRQQLLALSDRSARDGAVLVVDNLSGEVLAYVGANGREASAPFVDGVMARRQAGSTLKPFLYGAAIGARYITASTLIDDTPLEIHTSTGTYRPENYDHRFRGAVRAREALAASLNIPAIKVALLLGPTQAVATLKDFGFTQLADPNVYGPSIAVGAPAVSLWELVNAYRTLARGGLFGPLRTSFEAPLAGLAPGQQPHQERQAISPAVAFIVADILADRVARSETFGLESILNLRAWAAVKTGTSKDMTDNWCIGFTPQYTVGVWVGNSSGVPMWNVSGTDGAAPVWAELMSWLIARSTRTVLRPEAPAGIIRLDRAGIGSCTGSNCAARGEWYLTGTEPAQDLVRAAGMLLTHHISYPPDDLVVAVDPEIPADVQRVPFQSSLSEGGYRLRQKSSSYVEELPIRGSTEVLWQPRRGVFELELIDRGNVVLDKVHFSVK